MAGSEVRVEGWGTGQRLDVYLTKAGHFPSRSKAREAIDRGEVLLAGRRVAAHALVSEGQELAFLGHVVVTATRPAAPPLAVVHEDEDYAVIEKPAGVVVHDGPGVRGALLTDAVLARYPEAAAAGEPGRPGIVHRLDRDVSGLLVVARTPAGYAHFTDLFARQRVTKVYTALVHGVPAEESGEIRLKIGRSTRYARMAARPEGQEGKAAVTRYEVRDRFPNAALLSVRILTGRTHQIRAHLFAIGHPIVGDTLYPMRKKTSLALGRPFLHAAELRFTDPSGVERTFVSPLPDDLAAMLDVLRRKYHHRGV